MSWCKERISEKKSEDWFKLKLEMTTNQTKETTMKAKNEEAIKAMISLRLKTQFETSSNLRQLSNNFVCWLDLLLKISICSPLDLNNLVTSLQWLETAPMMHLLSKRPTLVLLWVLPGQKLPNRPQESSCSMTTSVLSSQLWNMAETSLTASENSFSSSSQLTSWPLSWLFLVL